ncbi:MAG TPA: serine protease [Solirubrobacterales bacterium]|nr:serine protease [Solirubrobacterales bacterium]
MLRRRGKGAARRQSSSIAVAGALLALALVGASAPTGASAASAKASIIGGHAASIAELPYLAYIEGEDAVTPYACTGTVVAPRVILTAGHCVEDLESGTIAPAEGFAVATGVSDLNQVTKANVSLVSQALVFPGFKPSKLQGDAGLLILATPTSAPPIALASAPDSGLLAAGTPLTLAGWGLTSPKAKQGPAQLQAGTTVVQDSASCRQQTRRYYPFYSAALQLCAIDHPGDKVSGCFGDSGGPAIATRADGSPVEVGIISTGGPGCNPHLPNVFTRVDQVVSWVGAWVAAVEAGAPAPAIKIPQAHVPFLSFDRAKELAGIAFAEDFRQHFTKASEKRISCRRASKARVKCGVAWYQGGNDYYGTITVFYAIHQNAVAWDDHYKIHWVNDSCYFRSGHRQSCVIHTKTH